jgi:hypothetical protein
MYFWTYIVIVYFILFNMALAIIMFVYEANATVLHQKAMEAKSTRCSDRSVCTDSSLG